MLTFYKNKNLILTLLVMGVLVLIAGCGRNRVDESLLPTAVPTLSSELATVAPTLAEATNTSEPTVSAVLSETATVADSAAQPTSPLAAAAIEATIAPTATATATLAVSATLTPTATATVKSAATITPTIQATATLMMTATLTMTTVPITAVQPITTAATLTTTPIATDTTTVNDAIESALPAAVAAGLKEADPANGQLLSQKNACIGCHSLAEGVKLVGPSWYGLADVAGERVAGQSAEEYLYTSIVKPNEHLVEGYVGGLMLQIYEATLSDQDKADVIAYLLTLKAK